MTLCSHSSLFPLHVIYTFVRLILLILKYLRKEIYCTWNDIIFLLANQTNQVLFIYITISHLLILLTDLQSHKFQFPYNFPSSSFLCASIEIQIDGTTTIPSGVIDIAFLCCSCPFTIALGGFFGFFFYSNFLTNQHFQSF